VGLLLVVLLWCGELVRFGCRVLGGSRERRRGEILWRRTSPLLLLLQAVDFGRRSVRRDCFVDEHRRCLQANDSRVRWMLVCHGQYSRAEMMSPSENALESGFHAV
jgi:hypothetical protein